MSAFANYAIYPQYKPTNILEVAILLIVIAGLATIASTAIIRRSQGADDPEDLSEPTLQQAPQDLQEPQILQDIPMQTSMKNEPRLSIDIEKISKGS